MKKLLLILILSLSFFSCKKEEPTCWHCVDSMGYNVPDICNKTSKEIHDQYPSYSCTKR